jgi:SAM-dependent methyltransferase
MVDKTLNYGRSSIAAFLRQISPFRNIVDLGAGWGSDLAIATELCPSSKRYAVETYPPYIEALKVQHEVLVLNLEKDPLPLEDESVDVVMSNQVLEHVKEIFWILHEASRTLRTGGHLIIGVPNLASFHNRLLLLLGRQPTVIQNRSAHLRGYTKHDLLRTFEVVFPGGYELEGFQGANFYPLPPMLARPMARLLPNGAWGIFLLLKKNRPYHDEFLTYPAAQKLETNFYLGNADTRALKSD